MFLRVFFEEGVITLNGTSFELFFHAVCRECKEHYWYLVVDLVPSLPLSSFFGSTMFFLFLCGGMCGDFHMLTIS